MLRLLHWERVLVRQVLLLLLFSGTAWSSQIELSGKFAFTDVEEAVVARLNTEFARELNAVTYRFKVEKIKPTKTGSGTFYKGNTIDIRLIHSMTDPTELSAVLCHELGHTISYSALVSDDKKDYREYTPGYTDVEGEADYFAAAKCLPRIRDLLPKPSEMPSFCLGLKDADRCAFVANAGMLAVQGMIKRDPWYHQGPVGYGTPTWLMDPVRTFSGYQDYSCRLRTFVAGAMCEVDSRLGFSLTDETVGACTTGSGTRPRCWYVPATKVSSSRYD